MEAYLKDLESAALEADWGELFSSARASIRKAFEHAAKALHEFAANFKRKCPQFIRRVGETFSLFLRKYKNDGIELNEETISDINDFMNEFATNMDDIDNTMNRHIDDLGYEMTGQAESFEDDMEELNGAAAKFRVLKEKMFLSRSNRKRKIDNKFFRFIQNKFNSLLIRACNRIEKFAEAYDRTAAEIHEKVVNPQHALAKVVVGIATVIITVLKLALECASSIVSKISREIMRAKGIEMEDISDKNIKLDPIIIGMENWLWSDEA